MAVGKMLNDNLGVLLTMAIAAIVGQSIISYANAGLLNNRLENIEAFAQQQRQINDASVKISESVAVMATRMNYFEKDLDRVFANMPATSGSSKN